MMVETRKKIKEGNFSCRSCFVVEFLLGPGAKIVQMRKSLLRKETLIENDSCHSANHNGSYDGPLFNASFYNGTRV